MARRGRKTPRRGARAAEPTVAAQALWPLIAGASLVFCALAAFDQFVLHTSVLTSFDGRAPLSPLYAFWMPAGRPTAALFVIVALAGAVLAPRLVDERSSEARFGTALLILAVALPLALFLVREGPERLGSQFLIYPDEEYSSDAHRITDFGGFIRHYVELAPYLSLHGRVHPPGFASFLFLVGRVASQSPLAAGIAILAVFAAGVLLAWRAFALVVGRPEARVAALLTLAVPSVLDFACTAMDAVFFTMSSAVLAAAFAGLSARGRPWHGALAGLALYAAMFCSFSAVLIALFVFAYAGAAWAYGEARRVPLQLAMALGGFAGAYVAVRMATGFDLWESFEVARRQHYQIMQAVIGRSVSSLYGPVTYGNVAALLIGSGLGVVPLFVRRVAQWASLPARRKCLVGATALTLVIACAGGVFTMETERILMFAMPWLAVSASGPGRLSDATLRLGLTAGWAQAFAMEALLFTLW